MTTQYTTILKLALPVQGELSGTWGDTVNDNITQMVEQAIAGKATINSWTANAHTLTTADGTTAEARCAILELTDTGTALTGAGTVTCPTNSKLYIVDNNTAQIITVKTSGGTGVAVPVGKTMLVYCDGTNVVEGVTHANSLSLGTSTVTADKILDEDNMASDSATAIATQQSIKAYVDSQVGSFDTLAEVLAQGNTTGGTDLAVSSGDDITFADNSKAIFGAGNDLQIYHDGTHSYVADAGTGSLFLRSGSNIYVQNAGGTANYFKGTDGGAAELFYNGSSVLATTATGIDVTGSVTIQGSGVGGTYITSSSGSAAGDIKIEHIINSGRNLNTINSESGSGSAIDLALATGGSEALRITSTGNVGIGTSTVNRKLEVAGNNNGGSKANYIRITDTDTSATASNQQGGIEFYTSDSGNENVTASIENLYAGSGAGSELTFNTAPNGSSGVSERLRITADGDISFYEDTGTTAKFFWDASAESLGIGTTTPGQKLEIKETATGDGDAIIRLRGDGNNADNTPLGSLEWFNADSSGAQPGVAAAVEAQSANANGHMGKLLFKTHDGSGSEADPPTTRMTIDQSGNVGIGTSSPSSLLHVNNTADSANGITIQNASASGSADAYLQFTTATSAVRMGIDATGTDIFKISNGTALGTNDALAIDSSGLVGIGTSTPSTFNTSNAAGKLVVGSGSGSEGITVYSGTTSNGALCFADGTTSTDTYKGYIQYNHNTNSMQFATGHTERMRIDSSGNVGIGTTSARGKLDVSSTDDTNGTKVIAEVGSATISAANNASFSLYELGTEYGRFQRARDGLGTVKLSALGTNSLSTETLGAGKLLFATNSTERMRIDASGNVGIGTTSPSRALEVYGAVAGVISITSNSTDGISSLSFGDTADDNAGRVNYLNASDAMLFYTATAERMRIASSGNVGIGTDNPTGLLHISSSAPAFYMTDTTNNTESVISMDNAGSLILNADLNAEAGSSNIRFAVDGTERMRIDASGNVGIGTATPSSLYAGAQNLVVGGGSAEAGMTIYSSTTTAGNIYFADGTTGAEPYAGYLEYNHASNFLRVGTAGTERMRIDSSGNLLVGKTSTGAATAGIELNGANDLLRIARDGGVLQELNRITSDGDIIEFRKDNSAVGSIGVASGDNMYITSSATNHVGLYLGGGGVLPMNSGSLDSGDNVDIGSPNYQFADLHLSGTANIGLAKLTNANTTSGHFMSIDAEGTTAVQQMTHYWYDGSYHNRFTVAGNTAATVVNEQGEDIDFRVETDATSNGFVVNAGAGIVGIGRDNVWSFGSNTTPGFTVNVTSGRVDVSADSVARITQINDETGTFDRFYQAGDIVGSITTDGTNTAFNTASDQRLKENILDAPSASDDIDAIQVRSFDWKADGSHQKYGMVAQELQTVAPEAVSEGETEEDMMGVDYSKLVPMLIKEIQSLRARVADLES